MSPIEFIGEMKPLDVLLIFIWVAVIFYGIRAGIVKVGFMAACVAVGAVGGAALSKPLSHLTGPWAGVSPERGTPITYFGLSLLIMVVLFIILTMTYRRTNITRNATAEAVVGGIGGFLLGLVMVNQFAGMLLVTTIDQWGFFDGVRTNIQEQLRSTPFIQALAARFPFVWSLVVAGLPASIAPVCDWCT
jgi:hypothetical protein